MIEEGISIIDEIKKGRYEASVMATFNAYFPFYEEIVLGHLRNAGSRQNVLLMDARVCGGILSLDSLRPRYAGREYFLLPINVRGAFHPKLALLLGKKKSLLLVGSHNLTLAGFSHNRELTNRFEIGDGEDEQAQLPFQTAWRFMTAWAASHGDLVQEAFDQISHSYPWLTKTEPLSDSSELVCVFPGGRPLFDQVLPRLPSRATRIIVTGPFFDTELAFLRMLRERYPSAEMVVGIDPNTVVITDGASLALPDVRFVTTDALNFGKGYMHAKAISFQDDGNEVLITGSANPSEPAWLSPVDKGGNVEAVVIHNSSRKASIGRLLGLSDLAAAPNLSAESWRAIATNRGRVETKLPSSHAPLLARASELGIEIDLTSLKQKVASEVRLLDSSAGVLQIANSVISGRRLIIEVPEIELTRRAAMVALQTDRGRHLLAIVHHTTELRELARTDRQRTMRQALDSTDAPLIEDLMRVIEKVIFDEELVLSRPKTANGDVKRKPLATEKIQTEFSIPLKDVARRHAAQKRIVSSGDLAVLLDALIHQLGVGLEARIHAARSIARSEEELVDSDDEEVLQIPAVDIEKLVALCQRKIRTVLRRMIRQLENAVGSTTGSVKALVQMAAVLGLIHRLCQVTSDEASWIPRGETLVPDDARYQFFIDATRLLYSPKNGLMYAAIRASGLDSSVELTMVRGLLIWLAWDSDFHVKGAANFEDAEEVEENLRGVARLLAMVPDLMTDPDSFQKARAAIDSSLHEYDIADDDDQSWVSDFEAWCADIARLLAHTPRDPVVSRHPDRGDIVHPFKLSDPHLAVVIEATQGKVTLGDLDSPDESKKFGSGYVRIVRIP